MPRRISSWREPNIRHGPHRQPRCSRNNLPICGTAASSLATTEPIGLTRFFRILHRCNAGLIQFDKFPGLGARCQRALFLSLFYADFFPFCALPLPTTLASSAFVPLLIRYRYYISLRDQRRGYPLSDCIFSINSRSYYSLELRQLF